MPRLQPAVLTVTFLALPELLLAQPPSPVPPKPASYSVPWLLRSVAPATVVRLDETLAFYRDPVTGRSGSTYVTSLTATYKASAHWIPAARVMWVEQDAPAGPSGSGFSNPIVGVSYIHPFKESWRWAAFGGSSLPIGSGGGDSPNPGAAAAMAAGAAARSGMDNALFAVDYWALIGGLALARVTPTASLQAEATVIQLKRVRGPEAQDGSRTNSTAGLHVGHFFSPRFSVGADVRMQHWLSDAAPVRTNPAARSQLTFAVGPRLHLKFGKRTLRPGVSYARAFDDPMAAKGYDVVQFDIPVVF